jgi:hypothetical protein
MIRRWSTIDIRWRIAAIALLAAIILPVAWYLGSPLFINVTVNERFPDAVPLAATTNAPTAQPTATAAPAPTAALDVSSAPSATAVMPAASVTPAAPVALSSGQFTEVDIIHKGEGTATIYRLPDNRQIIRFEPFKVQNGPDLYVYLSGHPMPRSSTQLHEQGTFEVARLKGNIGDQNYELPADLDLSQYRAVVIYCKRFSEIFSTAELLTVQN